MSVGIETTTESHLGAKLHPFPGPDHSSPALFLRSITPCCRVLLYSRRIKSRSALFCYCCTLINATGWRGARHEKGLRREAKPEMRQEAQRARREISRHQTECAEQGRSV